jgi:hypothetical protein
MINVSRLHFTPGQCQLADAESGAIDHQAVNQFFVTNMPEQPSKLNHSAYQNRIIKSIKTVFAFQQPHCRTEDAAEPFG